MSSGAARPIALALALALLACGPSAPRPAEPPRPTPPATAVADLDEASFSPAAVSALADLACPRVERPYLWRVEPRSPTAAPSYLLGTMHLGVAPAKLPASVLAALDGAQVVVFETDPAAPEPPAAPRAPSDLPAALGEAAWAHYQALLGAELAAALAGADPATAALMLMALYLDKTALLDETLGQRALRQGQATAGLETSAFQEALLARWLDLRALRAAIAGAADRRELRDEARDAVAEYCAGTDDSPGMSAEERAEMLAGGYTEAELEAFEEDLLWSRNRAWIPALERLLSTGGAAVVVGADHLRGDGSVVALLRAAGWTVTRVAP
ncbi:MAG: TraB/GumN family protein [Kofleriaceae bacterium]